MHAYGIATLLKNKTVGFSQLMHAYGTATLYQFLKNKTIGFLATGHGRHIHCRHTRTGAYFRLEMEMAVI
jgi:hypothetical protein